MPDMCRNVSEDGQVCSEVDINGVLELARTTGSRTSFADDLL
jgi:hypothetical protein